MKILVKVREMYGITRVYPMSQQHLWRKLTGTETFEKRHLEALQGLGYEFEAVLTKSGITAPLEAVLTEDVKVGMHDKQVRRD
jgi:hypothetical protein